MPSFSENVATVRGTLEGFSGAVHSTRTPRAVVERAFDKEQWAEQGGLALMVNTAVAKSPDVLEKFIRMIPGMLVSIGSVTGYTAIQGHYMIPYMIAIAQILELMGSLSMIVTNAGKFLTAAKIVGKPVDPTQAMMTSICTLNENQIRINRLQILLHLATTNLITLSSYRSRVETDYADYRVNIEMIDKEIKSIKAAKSLKIGECEANLKNGIPITDQFPNEILKGYMTQSRVSHRTLPDPGDLYVSAQDEGGGNKKQAKRKNKTGKRKNKTGKRKNKTGKRK